ncbi:hypothetical protein ACOI1C_17450 [Bacillus sp. DJP31]|uniref:hypothetical protein n=1 Tax=Bacillus sp. DJP31 TaxID=3409789 RepID=UPI003BB4F774
MDHDIPYSTDRIIDWDPDSSNDGPYQISFAYPYSISWGFSMNNNPKVSNIGSQEYDYGRWEVHNDFYSLSGLDGHRFEPSTTWKSSGTLAIMDIREKGYFVRNGITVNSSITSRVSYDY